jgi:hypothetical protein
MDFVECFYVNDNTAFVKIKKVTTNDTWQDEIFEFNYTTVVNTTSVSLTVQNGTNMNMTELIKIPSGLTSIEELTPPSFWKLDSFGCRLVTYDDQFNVLANVTSGNSTTLLPWQSLECTFTNDNTAFLKIIKNTTEISPDVIHNVFNFTYVGPAGETNTFVNVTAGSHSNMTEIFKIPTGNYNVTEDDLDNWVLQSSICTVYATEDGENPIEPQLFNVTGTDTENFDLEPWQMAICEFVNDNPVGYFTGGGRANLNQTDASTNNANITLVAGYDDQIIDKVTHGFQLHCDSNSGPNNLEVNWLGFKFHLEQLENALCFDDGSVNEPPPKSNGNPNSRKPTLDVYYGEGFGRYEGQCGAYAQWVMDDNGEPGKADQIVSMVIWDSNKDLVLNINPSQLVVTDTSISGEWKDWNNSTSPLFPDGDEGNGAEWIDLEAGNQQWTPHPFKTHGPKGTQPCEEQPPFTGSPDWEDPLTWPNP